MRSCLALLGFLLLSSPLHSQAGSITGTARDSSGAAVAGAIISIDATSLRTNTDPRGAYILRGVPAGAWTVRARAIGFSPVTAVVQVAGGAVTRDFTLVQVPVMLAPVDVVIGSRARHTAAEELAVPVDVITTEQIARVATTETNQILQELAPSVSFPRQSVSDASDIVRPFTMRGLNPDHSLVLLNGTRRHRTALVHIYNAGMGAGGSGVDLNTIPSSSIERMEVLRDGAAAQYGSDAIAGVVNVVLRDGEFTPFMNGEFGRHLTGPYPDDGNLYSLNGGWGARVGRGTLGIFAEYRNRRPTNRAGADPSDQIVAGDGDVVDEDGNVIEKNNEVAQPNHHWGDGVEQDLLSMLNLRLPMGSGSTELYAFGGYSHRNGTGNGYRRYGLSERNWPTIYPLGYLPQFDGKATDWSIASGLRGLAGVWQWDAGVSYGYNSFDYDLSNTMNVSLGPCLDAPCAPGLDGILGNADDPGIPNQTEIYAGSLRLGELTTTVNFSRQFEVGLHSPMNFAVGAQFRSESYDIQEGELASYVQGGHPDRNGDFAPAGSQVFSGFLPGFAGSHSRNNLGIYADLESELATYFLVNVAGRFEKYSDFGERLTGKLALRWQPTERVTLRTAFSTGFRAPALSQSWYASIATNFANDGAGNLVPYEVGIFPVDHPASQALGAEALKDETSVNVSGGLAFSPSDAVTLTLDGFYIKVNDRIMLTNELAGDDVEAILADAGVNARAARYFTNALDTESKGMDLTANWRKPLGSGRIDVTGYLNYTRNNVVALRVPPEIANTDATFFDPYLEGGTIALEKERPEWRAGVSVIRSGIKWDWMAKGSYYGSFQSALFGYSDSTLQTYGAKTVIDAEVGFRFTPKMRVALGGRNLFDSYPDRMSVDNGFQLFLHPPASPFGYNGRFVYARLEFVTGN